MNVRKSTEIHKETNYDNGSYEDSSDMDMNDQGVLCTKKETPKVDRKLIRKLDRMRYTQRFFTTVALVAFVATIIIIALSQARFMEPMIALYVFSGALTSCIITLVIECYHKRMISSEDSQSYYQHKEPFPEKKERPVKKEKKK